MTYLAQWWGTWPAWVPYAASPWSLTYGLLGIRWALGGPGFPFGENDPTRISILSELTAATGGPAIAVIGLIAALAGILMGQVRGRGIQRTILLGFGWTLSITLLLVIPDYRVLMAVAYGIVFLVGAPFNWPPANYFEIFAWPVVNQLIILLGGFLWSATTLAYGRLTQSACGNCGRCGGLRWPPQHWPTITVITGAANTVDDSNEQRRFSGYSVRSTVVLSKRQRKRRGEFG